MFKRTRAASGKQDAQTKPRACVPGFLRLAAPAGYTSGLRDSTGIKAQIALRSQTRLLRLIRTHNAKR